MAFLNENGVARLLDGIKSVFAHSKSLTPDFSQSSSYTKGAHCMHDGLFYVANKNVSSGSAFNSNDWDAAELATEVEDLQDEVSSNNEAISKLQDEIGKVVDGNSCSGFTLNKGDYVIVKNSTITGITDGLYTYSSSTSKSAGSAVSAGELTAVSGGVANELNSKLTVETSYVTKATGTDYINLGTVKKCGGVKTLNIIIRGAQTALPQSAWTIVGSVDSSCKPSSTFSAQLIDVVTFKPFSLSVDTNGKVSMYNRTGGKPEGEWQVAYI